MMKKIMFNDKYGLTNAVLQGHKTMTRRIVPIKEAKRLDSFFDGDDWDYAKQTCIDDSAAYKVGELVAVAQSYETLANCGHLDDMLETSSTFKLEYCGAGWSNKMFVRADLMPHRIKITDIKVERLQDISDYDCAKEGVRYFLDYNKERVARFYIDAIPNYHPGAMKTYDSVKDAFAALIDKVSGKGTWEKNPWVFCYSFERIK